MKKVHQAPMPRKRNITFHYNVNRSLQTAEVLVGRQKKLRRLPHIFSKVLELPFGSDADVNVQEDATGFVFVIAADDFRDDVRAHAVQIHPGVTKVVIRDSRHGDDASTDLPVDDLELDRWRFRLPSYTLPELAVANYASGELVVTIPKGEEVSEELDNDDGACVGGGGIGRLVSVQ